MSMFDRYPQPDDYVPNNRPKCHKPFKLDIMAGETASHTFEIPFNIEEDCNSVEVIYSLGIKPILIKTTNDLEISIDDCECKHSLVMCRLSGEETKLFADTLLSARVQLKFYMKNEDITYSAIYKINLLNSLDNLDN